MTSRCAADERGRAGRGVRPGGRGGIGVGQALQSARELQGRRLRRLAGGLAGGPGARPRPGAQAPARHALGGAARRVGRAGGRAAGGDRQRAHRAGRPGRPGPAAALVAHRARGRPVPGATRSPAALGAAIGESLPAENSVAPWWRPVAAWQGLLLGCGGGRAGAGWWPSWWLGRVPRHRTRRPSSDAGACCPGWCHGRGDPAARLADRHRLHEPGSHRGGGQEREPGRADRCVPAWRRWPSRWCWQPVKQELAGVAVPRFWPRSAVRPRPAACTAPRGHRPRCALTPPLTWPAREAVRSRRRGWKIALAELL